MPLNFSFTPVVSPVDVTGSLVLTDVLDFSTSTFPTELVESGGTLYYTAYDGVNGKQIWSYDGTVATSINPGVFDPMHLATDQGGNLYFSAVDSSGSVGRELWFYDGDHAVLVTDLYPGWIQSLEDRRNYFTSRHQ